MSVKAPETVGFTKALNALRPYLRDMVVVGGWAHRLFTFHELAREPGFQPLMTEDADIALPTRLGARGESIAILLKTAGFAESFFGDDKPPVAEYRLGDEDGGLYLEFLMPLIGSGSRPDGTRKMTAKVAGVTAQKLRYVDILLMEPWTVHLSDANGFPLGDGNANVQIPNAASYLAQKLLVLPERKPEKQAKDVLYIHDTLLIFSHAIDQIHEQWSRITSKLHPKALQKLNLRCATLFDTITDNSRSAALIAASTSRRAPPSADRIAATCRIGLKQIFG